MKSADFNRLVREAARNQPLRGVTRRASTGGQHHWMVSYRRMLEKEEFDFGINPLTGKPFFSDPVFQKKPSETDRFWRIFVGPGTVNDRMAGITYRTLNDPRGWTMPADYPALADAKKIQGAAPDTVDRPLTDRADPPHLLLTSPSVANAKDTGDFQRIEDKDRSIVAPRFFRTREMWNRDLYSAALFLTASPATASWVEGVSHFPLPTRLSRFTVRALSRMPNKTPGVNAGGDFPLATIYLTRNPRAKNPFTTDALYVRQLCYWSLWTANATPNALLSVAEVIAEGAFASNLGLLALPSGALAAEAFLAGSAIVTNIVLDELSSIFDAASSVEFWSAA